MSCTLKWVNYIVRELYLNKALKIILLLEFYLGIPLKLGVGRRKLGLEIFNLDREVSPSE